jgi:glycosyltransferase involved in cell wall biosynthesis
MSVVGLDVSALDPGFKSHAQRGIGRYVAELSAFFRANADTEDAKPEVDFFDHRSLTARGIAARCVQSLPLGRVTMTQQFVYPLALAAGEMSRFSFLHFPAHMDAPAWCPKPFVLTVLDLIPLVLHEMYRANKTGARYHFARFLEKQAMRSATLLLAISEQTARDVEQVLGIPRERIVVTPLGVDEKFFSVADGRYGGSSKDLRERLGIPRERPILLYVGGHDERKNIDTLVQIGRCVISERLANGERAPVLVLAGRVAEGSEAERLNRALQQHDMREHTIVTGFVADEDLLHLYGESAVFLFPSLYEGFGLPIVEAFAAGLPVVSSNTSAMPEVVGEAGLLFDPHSVEQGSAAALRILRDDGLARELSAQGVARARHFTWHETGRKTREAYRYAEELLARRRGTRCCWSQPSRLTCSADKADAEAGSRG